MQTMRSKRSKRRITVIALLLFLLCIAFIYVNDKAGGLSDWRMSKAMGMSGTIHIPIGKTPEEAIERFRGHNDSLQIIHQEPVDGGMVLFNKKRVRQIAAIFRWSMRVK